jgi:uncharacterized membrane protein
MNAKTVLLIIAAVLFLIAAIGPLLTDRLDRVNTVALGLFFWVLSVLIV